MALHLWNSEKKLLYWYGAMVVGKEPQFECALLLADINALHLTVAKHRGFGAGNTLCLGEENGKEPC